MAFNSGSPPDRHFNRVIEPFQNTLSRLREEPYTESPQALATEAGKWLESAFGVTEDPLQTGFSYGGLGLLAQHTSYFNGFAVILKIPRGIAVAARKAKNNAVRVSIQTVRDDARIGSREENRWRKVVEKLIARYGLQGKGVDIAIVSNIPPGCFEANLASLAVATGEVLGKFPESRRPADPLIASLESLEAVIGAEFSRAFLLAAESDSPDTFVVIDTETREMIPFDGPSRDQLCWRIFDAGAGAPRTVAFYKQCGAVAREALSLLKQGPFSQITSFREVAHKDLPRLLESLPRRMRPIVRHLVNENKRVNGLITAIRRSDWQMLGGLLLMSHASVQTEWDGTDARVDHVVEAVKGLGSEGMYGASMTGRSRCVLVAGQPLAIARAMARIGASFEEVFGETPHIWLL